ncbi:MAG: glutamate--tRNA ligase [Phycisphaerae bacterium]
MKSLNTRFAPSPTGSLHVGGARTALFSYALAKQTGGTFLLRIEDTDRARHDETSEARILQDLRWLGIEWDEGIEIGGDAGPYRQSERLDVYSATIQKLVDDGHAYYAFETAEQLEALREKARAEKRDYRYQRPTRFPTAQEADQAQAEGKPVVVRFKCPDRGVTIHDDVFGEVTMPADQMEDFIIRKADGWPTYHLANVTDDAMMGVNYVVRGQEFLGQTWRHVLLREALGFEEPGYCHLPLIMDMQGRKLSKRDGDVEVGAFRRSGYLPEALVSFLALLGWSPGDDRERLSLQELVESFSPDRVGKSNAKFDRDKLLAFNTDTAAELSPARLLEEFRTYLQDVDTPIPSDDDDLLAKLLEACKGFRTFADIPAKCEILFAPDEDVVYDEKAVKKVLRKNEGQGFAVLADLRGLLAECDWTPKALEKAITGFCEKKELGMGKVAQPLRVAITGKTFSPAIFDTLLFTGKEHTLARIDRCLELND